MTPAALTLAAVMVLAAGYAAAGVSGFFLALLLAVVLVLLALRLRIPSPPPAGPQRRSAKAAAPDFTEYEDIVGALGLATSSGWHFQRVTAPRLRSLLGDLLAYRRRTDISKDDAAARDALGPDLWPLLDPAWQPPADPDKRGPSLDTLRRIVERLEEL